MGSKTAMPDDAGTDRDHEMTAEKRPRGFHHTHHGHPTTGDAIDVAGEITEDFGGATVSAGASAEVTGALIVYELVVA